MEKRENKDGKLVRLAQSGDNDAMEQLCAEYKDTVRMLARPYFLIGADRDDLIQEGMIGLYKAIRDYREDHNSSFASFAELCITRQILSAINASRRQKHQPLNSYISLYRTPESGDRELLELIEQPGGDPEERKAGEEIAYTQPAVDLIQMVGKYMFGGGGSASAPASKTDPSPTETTP